MANKDGPDGYEVDPIRERGSAALSSGRNFSTSQARSAVDVPRISRLPDLTSLAAAFLSVSLCTLHVVAIYITMGQWEGISNEYPLLHFDHGIHFHHGLVARGYLLNTGYTAGYDPSFMSGFASSILSDLSSTLSDLAMLASPSKPAFAYKVYVFLGASLGPWLLLAAGILWRIRPMAMMISLVLYNVYFWTDFPIKYAELGMVSYLLSIPLGLFALAALSRYLESGGFGRWWLAAASCSVVFLTHLTSALLVGPAALITYAVAISRPMAVSRHFGFWMIAPIVLLANAFWWLPAVFLQATKGDTGGAFVNPDVWSRIVHIATSEAPILAILVAFGLMGLVVLARGNGIGAAALGSFLAVGFGWGYLAGLFRALDALQPGRHTYAFYMACVLGSGIALGEVVERLRTAGRSRLDLWLLVGFAIVSVRMLGPYLAEEYSLRFAGNIDPAAPRSWPVLRARSVPRLIWLVDRLREHAKPGERLLYEETGFGVANQVDPYGNRHFSGALPWLTGLEVIGGPFLHSTVTTNFTQFGEGKLCGDANWGVEQFDRYARIYRPTVIVCWTTKARNFCLSHPERIKVVADDGTNVVGRVLGFEGATSVGSASVVAKGGRLEVSDVKPGPDGLTVLRYHAIPYLQASPPATLEEVTLEEDPVPFIGLRGVTGPTTIELVLPPRGRIR